MNNPNLLATKEDGTQALPPLDVTHGLKIPDDLIEDYDEIGEDTPTVQGWRSYSNGLIERIAKREEELLAALTELQALKSAETPESAWKRGYELGLQDAIFNETGCYIEALYDVPPYAPLPYPEKESK